MGEKGCQVTDERLAAIRALLDLECRPEFERAAPTIVAELLDEIEVLRADRAPR
jgi:hypothetical protein